MTPEALFCSHFNSHQLCPCSCSWFLYFIERGSCIACFRYCRKKLSKSESISVDNDQDDKKIPCRFILNKWKQHLIHGLRSELLLYFIALADIYVLDGEEQFKETGPEYLVNFASIWFFPSISLNLLWHYSSLIRHSTVCSWPSLTATCIYVQGSPLTERNKLMLRQ